MDVLRWDVIPVSSAYAVFVAAAISWWRQLGRPSDSQQLQETPARAVGEALTTIAGGYVAFLAIVVVFHVWIAGRRGALRSAAVGGGFLAFGVAAVGVRMAVVGLGKLGGAELNYASDVDVIFVHESGPGKEAERAAGQLIRLLSEPNAEGLALRVDPALRPGGRGGALSQGLEATL